MQLLNYVKKYHEAMEEIDELKQENQTLKTQIEFKNMSIGKRGTTESLLNFRTNSLPVTQAGTGRKRASVHSGFSSDSVESG